MPDILKHVTKSLDQIRNQGLALSELIASAGRDGGIDECACDGILETEGVEATKKRHETGGKTEAELKETLSQVKGIVDQIFEGTDNGIFPGPEEGADPKTQPMTGQQVFDEVKSSLEGVLQSVQAGIFLREGEPEQDGPERGD